MSEKEKPKSNELSASDSCLLLIVRAFALLVLVVSVICIPFLLRQYFDEEQFLNHGVATIARITDEKFAYNSNGYPQFEYKLLFLLDDGREVAASETFSVANMKELRQGNEVLIVYDASQVTNIHIGEVVDMRSNWRITFCIFYSFLFCSGYILLRPKFLKFWYLKIKSKTIYAESA